MQHQRELKFPEQSNSQAAQLKAVLPLVSLRALCFQQFGAGRAYSELFEALSLAEISGLAKPRAVPPAFIP